MFGKVVKIGIILMSYCFISAVLLAIVQGKTKPKLDEVNAKKRLQCMKEVLPNADRFVERKSSNGLVYFEGFSSNDSDQVVGYVIETRGRGYSSEIVTIVGIDTAFNVVKIYIMSQAETPGLGTKAVESKGGKEPPFQAQFAGKNLDEIRLDKDGGKLVSLTGATITSRAVVNSVANGISALKEALGK